MVPDDEHLVALTHALLTNAADLTADARTLFEKRRWARTYALAALAGEELGKAGLCLEALLDPGPVDEKAFKKAWTSHSDKLASLNAYRAAFVDDVAKLDLENLRASTERVARRKMEAIYVDISNSGHIRAPSQISSDEAADLLDRVDGAIRHATLVLSNLSAGSAEAIRRLTSLLFEPLGTHMDSLEPEELVAALRDLMRRLPGLTDEDFIEAAQDGKLRELLGF